MDLQKDAGRLIQRNARHSLLVEGVELIEQMPAAQPGAEAAREAMKQSANNLDSKSMTCTEFGETR